MKSQAPPPDSLDAATVEANLPFGDQGFAGGSSFPAECLYTKPAQTLTSHHVAPPGGLLHRPGPFKPTRRRFPA